MLKQSFSVWGEIQVTKTPGEEPPGTTTVQPEMTQDEKPKQPTIAHNSPMTIQNPSPPDPEMPDKPRKPGPEMPDKPRKPGPEIEGPNRAYQPEVKKRPDEPFWKPEIDVPGPNLPTPDNPEGRDVDYRPPGS